MKQLKTYSLLFFLMVSSISFSCPTISLSKTDVTCHGGFDGIVTVVIGGTDPLYNYNWTLGSLNGGANNVSAGTYTVSGLPSGVFSIQVTDNLGCTSVQVITVYEPDAITAHMLINDVK